MGLGERFTLSVYQASIFEYDGRGHLRNVERVQTNALPSHTAGFPENLPTSSFSPSSSTSFCGRKDILVSLCRPRYFSYF